MWVPGSTWGGAAGRGRPSGGVAARSPPPGERPPGRPGPLQGRVEGEKVRGRLAGTHDGVGHQPAQEREVRRNAADLGLAQGSVELVEGLVARRGARDELREQGVVGGRHPVALLDAGIDANSVAESGGARAGRPAGER